MPYDPIRTLLATALALTGLITPPAIAQTQYKWVDRDGRTNFGDNPPRDARNVQQIGVASAPATGALDGLPYEVRRAAERFPVTLYTVERCASCDSGRTLLRARGVPFAERTITSTADREAFERLGAGDQVPMLLVGSQRARGFETGAWNGLLDAAGYPRESRLPANWAPPAARPLADNAESAPK